MCVCVCVVGARGGCYCKFVGRALWAKETVVNNLFAKVVHKTLHSCYIYLGIKLNIPSIGMIAIELVGRSVL